MKSKFLIAVIFFTTIISAAWTQSRISLKASCEQYFLDEYEPMPDPNANGVYPVKLTITTKTADKTLYIKIYRAESVTGPFSLIIDSMQGNEEYFDLYDSEPALPGQKYYYQAVLGRYKLEEAPADCVSEITCGWGALTHEALFVYVNAAFNKSYDKMTIMNKPGALSKLGIEEIRGNTSGTFKYEAKIKGMGGVATLTYSNYSDDGLLTINGSTSTTSDMLLTGSMEGILKVNGMYNVQIDYSKVQIKKGKAGGGTYGIIPAGAPRKEIEYTWNTDRPR